MASNKVEAAKANDAEVMKVNGGPNGTILEPICGRQFEQMIACVHQQ